MLSTGTAGVGGPRSGVIARLFSSVRSRTLELIRPLSAEDLQLQSMPDASPGKWHLAHTTWFFEEFVLGKYLSGFEPFDPSFRFLFNSYYDSVGERHPRPERGMLSRPTAQRVLDYRAHVDEQLLGLFGSLPEEGLQTVEVGLHHEMQHQELLLTDLLHAFSRNELNPTYALTGSPPVPILHEPQRYLSFDAALRRVGQGDHDGFGYDNERPRHRVFLEPYALSSRLVTNAEYLAFVDDGGYERPELWLSEGWVQVKEQQWSAPLYWRPFDDGWQRFSLRGLSPLVREAPVCHVSLFEADAYARWAGARLPTEFEWESAATPRPVEGNLLDDRLFDAIPARPGPGLGQLFGDVWEWTTSSYGPYPGYRPWDGALGEYNGKFMCNQYVLRGGSFATSREHLRGTYRNFFPANARWQFTGIRLAR